MAKIKKKPKISGKYLSGGSRTPKPFVILYTESKGGKTSEPIDKGSYSTFLEAQAYLKNYVNQSGKPEECILTEDELIHNSSLTGKVYRWEIIERY